MTEQGSSLADAIEDAVATFDAANLTWGQFYQNMWLQRGVAGSRQTLPVREALGEAALSVPATQAPDEVRRFIEALDRARTSVSAFVDACDHAAIPGDVREVPALLNEAIGGLRLVLGGA